MIDFISIHSGNEFKFNHQLQQTNYWIQLKWEWINSCRIPSLFLAPLIDRSFNSYELFAHSLKSFLLIIQLLVYSTAISFLSLLSDIDFSSSLTEIKWRNARRRKLNLNSEWIMTEFQFNSFKPEKIEPLLNNEAAIN